MTFDSTMTLGGSITGRWRRAAMTAVMAVAGGVVLSACADTEAGDARTPTWEEFRQSAFEEPQTGVFVVDGDIALPDLDALEAYYWDGVADSEREPAEQSFRLAINILRNTGGEQDKWSLEERRRLSYCVSEQQWGTRYAEIVDAMASAAASWNQSTNVNLVHDSSQDENCNENNPEVVFDVRPVTGTPYIARAFFPSYDRDRQNVLINTDYSFPLWPPLENVTLIGVLKHELGHVLGFRHEHIRFGEQNGCIEGGEWQNLTPYDLLSVMHYPHCDGSNTQDLDLTARDIDGARKVYDGGRLRQLQTVVDEERCLSSGSGAAGASSRLEACGSAATDWLWDYLWADSFNYDVRLRSQGRCLTAVNPTAGAGLTMQPCDDSAAQRWRQADPSDGSFQLETMSDSSLCMAVIDVGPWTRGRLEPCAGGDPTTRFRSPLQRF
ncbi:MAG: hypothetical protein AAGF11_14915 [Myxococcota bacterium]